MKIGIDVDGVLVHKIGEEDELHKDKKKSRRV